MKKLILILAFGMFATTVFSQEIIKNDYVQNGDLIEATLYHENGAVAQKGFYTLENKLQGAWTSYDTEGNQTAVAHYENGKKTGTWQFYGGDVMKEVTYRDTRIAEVNTWQVTDKRVVGNYK